MVQPGWLSQRIAGRVFYLLDYLSANAGQKLNEIISFAENL